MDDATRHLPGTLEPDGGAGESGDGAPEGGLSPFYDEWWLDLLREYEDVCAALEAAYRTDDDDAHD